MCYRPDGTASFTGFQRTVGKLAGRRAASCSARMARSRTARRGRTGRSSEGSATGDLSGLSGTGTAVTTNESGGDFILDYELG